jgi:hypothetical protein
MGSWSNLANMSKNNIPNAAKKAATMQSFELFKKQAKEKEERVSLILCCQLVLIKSDKQMNIATIDELTCI